MRRGYVRTEVTIIEYPPPGLSETYVVKQKLLSGLFRIKVHIVWKCVMNVKICKGNNQIIKDDKLQNT